MLSLSLVVTKTPTTEPAGERLVQHDHLGCVDQGCRQLQALLRATGQLVTAVAPVVAEVELLQHRTARLVASRRDSPCSRPK